MSTTTSPEKHPPEPSAPVVRAASVAFRTSAVYAIVAGLWILVSDQVTAMLFKDPGVLVWVAMLKGFAFVGCTALLLYGALRAQLHRWETEVRARQATERALRFSERMLAHAQQLVQVGGWIVDPLAGEMHPSPQAARLFGCPPGVQTMDAAWRMIHPDDLAGVRARWATALEGADLEIEYRAVIDGQVRWLYVKAEPERDASGRVIRVVGVTQDVTARKEAEEQLRTSEERLRLVVETIHEVFWIADERRERLHYLSPRFAGIWGRPGGDLERAAEQWRESIHPDDRERMLARFAAGHVDGRFDESYRILRPGGEIRWVRDQAFPVRDPDGVVRRLVGVAEDITERKHLEQQFLRAQRLEAIGTLASGIAHDMNNILAPMTMVPRLLRHVLTKPNEHALLDVVEQGAQRGAGIVRQLLTFSRGLEGQRGPVQVTHLLKEMTGIMRETFPREIEILQTTGTGLWPVSGDATQLHQVLMNLCVNARDAMPQGGRLRLTAENVELDAESARIHSAARPGRYVILTVADTGMGMTPEILERVFDPFFTTKDVGKGTGLGLSTVLGIVKSHAGFITVESHPGHGSLFRVYLPAAAVAEGPAAETEPEALPRGNLETILIVDDEAALRKSLELVLRAFNYDVLVAADGHEALRLFEANQGRLRLLFTDLMMPGMSGFALIRAIRPQAPELPIVASSGLERDGYSDELVNLGVAEVLRKPFKPEEILGVLHRLLAGRK